MLGGGCDVGLDVLVVDDFGAWRAHVLENILQESVKGVKSIKGVKSVKGGASCVFYSGSLRLHSGSLRLYAGTI